jgi:hypothetical protein
MRMRGVPPIAPNTPSTTGAHARRALWRRRRCHARQAASTATAPAAADASSASVWCVAGGGRDGTALANAVAAITSRRRRRACWWHQHAGNPVVMVAVRWGCPLALRHRTGQTDSLSLTKRVTISIRWIAVADLLRCRIHAITCNVHSP